MNFLLKPFTFIQVGLFRISKGTLPGSIRGFKMLLLTTTGRKSGKTRTTPVGRFDQPGGYVIVASNGGQSKNPAWYLNLKSNPHVTIQIGDRVMPAMAEILTGAARAQAWQNVIATSPAYANYEKRTTRQIPLVFLHPNQ